MDHNDEIAIIAREYRALGTFKCRRAIQWQLDHAVATGDWNEFRKWQRVQRCLQKLAVRELAGASQRAADAAQSCRGFGPAPHIQYI